MSSYHKKILNLDCFYHCAHSSLHQYSYSVLLMTVCCRYVVVADVLWYKSCATTIPILLRDKRESLRTYNIRVITIGRWYRIPALISTNGPYVHPPLCAANAYQARIFTIMIMEEETQSFRHAGRYLNLASFFSRAMARACSRIPAFASKAAGEAVLCCVYFTG